jgi:hypothetical protein
MVKYLQNITKGEICRMKYTLTPGHIVFTLTSGRIEEANVIRVITGNSFLVLIKSNKSEVEVTYGKDMFLTNKKANIVLSDMINIKLYRKANKNVPKPPLNMYTICERCGSVSSSEKICECRYGQ